MNRLSQSNACFAPFLSQPHLQLPIFHIWNHKYKSTHTHNEASTARKYRPIFSNIDSYTNLAQNLACVESKCLNWKGKFARETNFKVEIKIPRQVIVWKMRKARGVRRNLSTWGKPSILRISYFYLLWNSQSYDWFIDFEHFFMGEAVFW